MNAQTNSLAGEKLILVRLKTHTWSGRKYDRTASEQVAEASGGEGKAAEQGRYNKILVARESLLPVRRAATELLNRHYYMTAPWSDEGVRVLPAELYFEYTKAIREGIAEFEKRAKHFAENVYPAQRAAAQKRLGSLFKPADYPSVEEVRFANRVPEVHFEPLPNPEDVRVWGVGDVAAQKIEAEVRESVRKSIDAAHQHVATELLTLAQGFVERLRAFDAFAEKVEAARAKNPGVKSSEIEREEGEARQIRESAIENLRKMVQVVLAGLNVKHDPALTDMARALDVSLKGLEIDELRADATVREKKIAEVDRIAGKFAGVFGPAAKTAGGAR